MRLLSRLPLPWVRAMGWLLGMVLYGVAVPRRRVATTNLALCFPALAAPERRALARRHFVLFGQAWLDRSWLWHGDPQVTQQRLRITGDVQPFATRQPFVIFAPHFVGLDAGWTALTQTLPRKFATIYMPQSNQQVDRWVLSGRLRFGDVVLFPRAHGVRKIALDISGGALLYLLPDLDYGPAYSEFVDFFGVPAATTTSLSRFCRVGRARAVTVTSLMTAGGYDIHVGVPWDNFPTADAKADTRLMNATLEELIRTDPAQYLWTHRRFKTRPDGEPGLY
ncbi:MAG: lipid A biosynthesis acyltransferase [Bdellovibrionales bacterium]|nr:lipid A biosynthesis acyltransferase [Ramlibacter sp.]